MTFHAYNFTDPVQAHDAMCEQLIWGENSDALSGKPDYDWTHGTEVGLHNVGIHCKTVDFNYDLKRLWIPSSRWTMMIRQYIDPDALTDCLAKVEERMSGPKYGGSQGRGIAVMRTRLVQGKGVGRGVRRRWGSCMLNLSFRRLPVPTVTLHSRTTYFGYLAMLDLAVTRAFAAECAKITDTPLHKVEFVWNLELAQFHGFRSLAWLLTDESIRLELERDLPDRLTFPSKRAPGNQVGYRKALDGYARIKKSDDAGVLYGDESFSSFARVRRRFHTEVFGRDYSAQFNGGTRRPGGTKPFDPLPHLWVESLDLMTPLSGRSGDGTWFDNQDLDDEDED
jgi:hypothetical protein